MLEDLKKIALLRLIVCGSILVAYIQKNVTAVQSCPAYTNIHTSSQEKTLKIKQPEARECGNRRHTPEEILPFKVQRDRNMWRSMSLVEACEPYKTPSHAHWKHFNLFQHSAVHSSPSGSGSIFYHYHQPFHRTTHSTTHTTKWPVISWTPTRHPFFPTRFRPVRLPMVFLFFFLSLSIPWSLIVSVCFAMSFLKYFYASAVITTAEPPKCSPASLFLLN